jgi:hypothetical protein
VSGKDPTSLRKEAAKTVVLVCWTVIVVCVPDVGVLLIVPAMGVPA